MPRFALAFAAAATLFAAPAFADPAGSSLTLDFQTTVQSGKVMVALYDSEEGYRTDRPVRTAVVNVTAGQHEAAFLNLTAGDYAAKTFHDVDDDGSMNRNPFGMPTEPFAFTNNAVGAMGPATWDRAKVAVSGAVSQTISFR